MNFPMNLMMKNLRNDHLNRKRHYYFFEVTQLRH